MGPSVTGKNRIPRRRNSRSQSRKCSPARSWIVRRPFGRLSGASMGTRSGRACCIVFRMSLSLNATDVCACEPRRRHRPVGRRGEPARSIPSTTNGLRCDATKVACPVLLLSLVLGAMTYLQTVAAGIFEKDGVVTGFPGLWNFISGSFDVPRSRTNNNLSQLIDLAGAVSPKRNAALVGHMLRRLGNAEKLRDAVSVVRLKLQPTLDSGVASEAECGQERFVERSCLGKAAHSEVNVVVVSAHGEMA